MFTSKNSTCTASCSVTHVERIGAGEMTSPGAVDVIGGGRGTAGTVMRLASARGASGAKILLAGLGLPMAI